MKEITFQLNSFYSKNKYYPERFSKSAMILVCLNDFLTSCLLKQLFGLPNSLQIDYKYKLSEHEINFLGKILDSEHEKYFSPEFMTFFYNFNLQTKRKKFRGIIEVNTTFEDKHSLENSYFAVQIKISPENNLELEIPDYSLGYIKKIYAEFLEMFWGNILKQIKKSQFKGFKIDEETKSCFNYITGSIPTDAIFTGGDILLEDFDPDESIISLYHTLFHLILTNNSEISITTDEILECLGRLKNINYHGIRGGFKEKQRTKTEKNLLFLASIEIINLTQIEKHKFVISISAKILKNTQLYTIPQKLLTLNSKNNIFEKRIGEYINFKHLLSKNNRVELKISELTNIIEDKIHKSKPSEIRDKIEKTLDFLESEKIVDKWEYKTIEESLLSGKNWLEKYKKYKIIINF